MVGYSGGMSEARAPTDATAMLAVALTAVHDLRRDALDGTVADLARRLDLADRLVSVLQDLGSELTETLAERMEADFVQVADLGWLERTPAPPSTAGSRWVDARRDAARVIARQVALNVETGEIRPDWEFVARAALDLMDRSFSMGAAKAAFVDVLGFRRDEYEVLTPRGYRVAIRPVTP